MNCIKYLKPYILTALALLLCGCPQDSANERPAKGRWAAQDGAEPAATAEGGDHSGSPSPAGSPGGKSPDKTGAQDADNGQADDEAAAPPADVDPGTEEDDSGSDEESGDEAPDEDPETGKDEAEPEPEAAPADPPAAAGVDLSGRWLPLFGRGPQGVKPELWKSGKHVLISGSSSALEITPGGGSSFDLKNPGKLSNVRLSRSGPFLVVDQGNSGRTAYLNLDTGGGELPQSGQLSGTVGQKQFSGSFRTGSSGLKIDMDDGSSFSGKAAGGAWCGFLETGRIRGYCVLAMTGNGSLTGIVFVDPYMSFETALSFEIVQ